MSKSKELNTATAIVKDILTKFPETRNSDDILYLKVCEAINPCCMYLSLCAFFKERKKLGIPAFESVRRTRQKIQAVYPDLAGCEAVEGQRTVNEVIFKEYSRKVDL